jgi:hypothetical protein
VITTEMLRKMPADSLSLKIDLSPELIEALAQIETTTGDSLDEVLGKAIALYRMSVEAHKEGKRIGVFDRDWELEREVVGFEHQASS